MCVQILCAIIFNIKHITDQQSWKTFSGGLNIFAEADPLCMCKYLYVSSTASLLTCKYVHILKITCTYLNFSTYFTPDSPLPIKLQIQDLILIFMRSNLLSQVLTQRRTTIWALGFSSWSCEQLSFGGQQLWKLSGLLTTQSQVQEPS